MSGAVSVDVREGRRWVSLTDEDVSESEAATLDSILPMALDMGAAKATTCGYDKDGYPLGSVTVALVGGATIGIAVRNTRDEHAVIVTVMADQSRSDQSSMEQPAESGPIGPDSSPQGSPGGASRCS
jgi:hypothetical protein